jgi:prepilin-type N-terminal cleavage/methylation domain-containing protein
MDLGMLASFRDRGVWRDGRYVRGTRGFTLIELLVVIAILVVVLTLGATKLEPGLSSMKADSAAESVQTQLREAREIAMSRQRDVRVQFNTTTNEITLTLLDLPLSPSNETVLRTVRFENRAAFRRVTGLPETPDPWGGSTGAIAFNGATAIRFTSEGTAVDNATGDLINGRVFIALPNTNTSAAVVSVFGATGRIRRYRWKGTWTTP